MSTYNVLYISNEGTLGGAAQSLLDMLKSISNKNIKPIVIIPEKGVIEERLNEMNVTYYVVNFKMGYGKIGEASVAKNDENFWDNYEAAIELQKIIQEEKIHLVHINSSVSNVGAIAAIMEEIPYVWHLREMLEEDFGCEFWDKGLKMKLINLADEIITISNVVQRSYKCKYDIDSVRIYDGLDVDRFLEDVNVTRYDFERERMIITGAVTVNKGQYDAVKAINQLVQEGYKNVHLWVIGPISDGLLWRINKYIKKNHLEENIEFLPFQKDLSFYRRQCQYALTTSKMEALGRCTIEAMLAGNIVIGANTGGTLEIIGGDEERGFLYRQGDEQNLAEVMKRIISLDDVKKQKYKENAQRYAVETFGLDTYANQLLQLYESVIIKYNSKMASSRQEILEEMAQRYHHLVNGTIRRNKSETEQFASPYQIIVKKWRDISERGGSIRDYFISRKLFRIAIYGMGSLGCRLYDELEGTEICVEYVVDRDDTFLKDVIEVKKPEDKLDDTDLLVVAVSRGTQEIINAYSSKYYFPVKGLPDIINELYEVK